MSILLTVSFFGKVAFKTRIWFIFNKSCLSRFLMKQTSINSRTVITPKHNTRILLLLFFVEIRQRIFGNKVRKCPTERRQSRTQTNTISPLSLLQTIKERETHILLIYQNHKSAIQEILIKRLLINSVCETNQILSFCLGVHT